MRVIRAALAAPRGQGNEEKQSAVARAPAIAVAA
jgi:hypothetical protein